MAGNATFVSETGVVSSGLALAQAKKGPMADKKVADSQVAKFRRLAHELECDEDEDRFDERLRKAAKPEKAKSDSGHGPPVKS